MCMKKYSPPEMLPYLPHDREAAMRLISQERFDMMISGRNKNKDSRRSEK